MFRAEPPPQKQRPAPSALLEARFRNVEFYKPNKVFQLLGRGLVAWVGALAVGRARGSPSGCVWAGSSTGCRLTPLRTLAGEEVACPGWSGGHGQRTGAASAPSLGRGSRPPSPHPGSPAQAPEGPRPSVGPVHRWALLRPQAWPSAGLSRDACQASYQAHPTRDKHPIREGMSEAVCREQPLPGLAHPDMGGVILTLNLVTHDLS